jgi:hypothetical protein
MSATIGMPAMALQGIAVFLSAFLLFLVQPVMSIGVLTALSNAQVSPEDRAAAA